MAKIILDPLEIFEHSHNEESVTILEQGEVLYKCGDVQTKLTKGMMVITPANCTHILENIGSLECIVACSHGSPPEKKYE